MVSILQHRRHIFSLSFRLGAYSYYIYQCIPPQPGSIILQHRHHGLKHAMGASRSQSLAYPPRAIQNSRSFLPKRMQEICGVAWRRRRSLAGQKIFTQGKFFQTHLPIRCRHRTDRKWFRLLTPRDSKGKSEGVDYRHLLTERRRGCDPRSVPG